jgi:hypothetical protein
VKLWAIVAVQHNQPGDADVAMRRAGNLMKVKETGNSEAQFHGRTIVQ